MKERSKGNKKSSFELLLNKNYSKQVLKLGGSYLPAKRHVLPSDHQIVVSATPLSLEVVRGQWMINRE